MGTESNVYIKLMGPKKKQSGKLFLEFAQKKRFEPASMETFSVEAVDVKEVQEIEVTFFGPLVILLFFFNKKRLCFRILVNIFQWKVIS